MKKPPLLPRGEADARDHPRSTADHRRGFRTGHQRRQAGVCRLLGAVVRTVPDHRSDRRGARPRLRREGRHRQDERRREPGRADEVRRDLDPDAADVQGRQARRPRHRRDAEGEPQGLHRQEPVNGRKPQNPGVAREASPGFFLMLADLDHLLHARGIDTLIVPMHEVLHPAFRWITRGAKVTKGYAVKRAGEAPILVTYPMERGEAAATGLPTRLVHDFDHDRIFKSAPNPVAAYGEFFDRVLRDIGSGPAIAFAGNLPIHLYLGIAHALAGRGWNVVRSAGEDLVQLARKRKEPWEIEAIRSVGERTEQVVDRVREVLREAIVEDGHVLHRSEVLTLGHLKQLVSSEIARLGMVEDHETILSQGRDAAVPHSRGDADAPVRPSLPIVLDIFPLDRESGYFFDMTRTFCVGPIPGELAAVHAHVLEAFELAEKEMVAGTPAASYQSLVCDFFEAR